MKIFVSYSFRPENDWVEKYVIPLVESFGHKAVTGQILEGAAIPDEVKQRIRGCRRVLCFTTRSTPRYNAQGQVESYEPPDWVRDELMLARGRDKVAVEFREDRVVYGGAASFVAWHAFKREELPELLVRLACLLSAWPVGPLQLRLNVPPAFALEVENAANARQLKARCLALDEAGDLVGEEELPVHVHEGRLTVPFWIKPDPGLSIEIEISIGNKRLACRGISPAVREARLQEG